MNDIFMYIYRTNMDDEPWKTCTDDFNGVTEPLFFQSNEEAMEHAYEHLPKGAEFAVLQEVDSHEVVCPE